MSSSTMSAKSRQKVHLMFFVTEDWYFCSHRLSLARSAREAGYEVSVVTRVRHHGAEILDAGIELISLELSRGGKNPFAELLTLRKLWKIYKTRTPDIVHHVALKPVIYGSIAARLAGVRCVVNALTGLGFLFSSRSLWIRSARPFVKRILRAAINTNESALILQNPDDIDLICESGVVDRGKVKLIRGSGVDLAEFSVRPEPQGAPVVILASRLLWDKGVGEFVEAAREIRKTGIKVRFALVGMSDAENPSAISDAQLKAWAEDGLVELWGHRNDMPEVMASAHVVCLPSYREGLPKVLIEAASCGRPIVTTDVPGCREVVKDGHNGFLVPAGSASELTAALSKLVNSSDLRNRMGMAGREVAEQNFSIDKVVDETLGVYESFGR